jgi:hypothetical protein
MKAQSSLVSSNISQAMLASSKKEARFAGGTTSRSMNGSDTDRLPRGAKVYHQGTIPNDSAYTKALQDSVESSVNRIMHPQVGEGGGPGAVKSWRNQKDDAGYPKNDSDIPEDWEEQYHKDFPTPGGQDWPQQPNPPASNTGAKGHSGSSSSHAAAAGGQGGTLPDFVSGPSVSPGLGSGAGGPVFKSQSNTGSEEDAPVNQIVNALDTSSKPALLNSIENSLKSKLRPTGEIIDSPRGQVIGVALDKLGGKDTVIFPSKPSKGVTKTDKLVKKGVLLQAPTSGKTVKTYVALSDPKGSDMPKVCGCKALAPLALSKKRPQKGQTHQVIDGDKYKNMSKFSLQKPSGIHKPSGPVFDSVVKGSSKRPKNHQVTVATVSVNGGRTYNTLAYKVD